MSLSIVVRLRSGRYEAASLRPQIAEWPPAPARVFCALVASADTDADWASLTWLEAAGRPYVLAARSAPQVYDSGYVVTNATEAKSGSQTWPGRNNGLRQRATALPADDTFAMVWPDADPDDATLGRLVRLARRVPYVGRSTSSAEVTVEPGLVEQRPGWLRWQSTALGSPGAVELSVPFPGYTSRLRDAFEHGQRAWEVGRSVAYEAPGHDTSVMEVPADSPYTRMLIFGFDRGRVPVSGYELLRVTEAFRQATISRVADPVPAPVSGHDTGGAHHVAYLGLPHVGGPHADGHLLGVAVAIPTSMSDSDRKALLVGLLKPPIEHLRFGARQQFELTYAPQETRGLQPWRWTGGDGGSRCWATATPLMLDRFPKGTRGAGELVAQSLLIGGYPEPVKVEVLDASAVAGAPHRLGLASLSFKRPRRPLIHCRVEFASPVRGPVVAGALRYLGGGLFVPIAEGGR